MAHTFPPQNLLEYYIDVQALWAGQQVHHLKLVPVFPSCNMQSCGSRLKVAAELPC